MLHRLAKLYQVPNWDGENAVLLAKWIITKYECEPLDVVLDCLINPPATQEKNWRLTPDTIQAWFAIRLEEQAVKREKEYQREKERLKNLENQVPERNWPDFDKLLAGTWYEDAKNGNSFEKKLKEVKEDYFKNKPKESSALEEAVGVICEVCKVNPCRC